MRFKRIVAVFIMPLFMLSCQKNDHINESPKIAATTMLNVSYGADALQNMDVYLPANRSTAATPVCIMIHGGSWTGGDKNYFAEYADTFKKDCLSTLYLI